MARKEKLTNIIYDMEVAQVVHQLAGLVPPNYYEVLSIFLQLV
jgi:hypothetical protein